MKKKLLSLALALAMCLGLTVPASAELLFENVPLNGNIKASIDSNGTLSLTGTGELDLDIFYAAGEEFLTIMIKEEEYKGDTLAINIASGITIADKNNFEVVCTNLRTSAANLSDGHIKTVNINRSNAPASTPAPGTASKFTDVAANSPYKEAIDWAVENNITKGTTATTFGPNQTCTVAHILTFIGRYQGGDPSREDINKLCEGFSEDPSFPNLKPDQSCTRAMAVQFLFLYSPFNSEDNSNQPTAFSDVPADSSLLPKAVNWAVEKGITKGTSATTFSPDNICTRGQIVTFLYRLTHKAK